MSGSVRFGSVRFGFVRFYNRFGSVRFHRNWYPYGSVPFRFYRNWYLSGSVRGSRFGSQGLLFWLKTELLEVEASRPVCKSYMPLWGPCGVAGLKLPRIQKNDSGGELRHFRLCAAQWRHESLQPSETGELQMTRPVLSELLQLSLKRLESYGALQTIRG